MHYSERRVRRNFYAFIAQIRTLRCDERRNGVRPWAAEGPGKGGRQCWKIYATHLCTFPFVSQRKTNIPRRRSIADPIMRSIYDASVVHSFFFSRYIVNIVSYIYRHCKRDSNEDEYRMAPSFAAEKIMNWWIRVSLHYCKGRWSAIILTRYSRTLRKLCFPSFYFAKLIDRQLPWRNGSVPE